MNAKPKPQSRMGPYPAVPHGSPPEPPRGPWEVCITGDLSEQVGVRGTAVDAQGRTYLGTAAGIQVLDQLGRVHFIIRPPAGTMTDLTFGGRDRHELYAVANGRLFVRPLKTTGVCPAAAPVKPPRPRL